MLHNCISTKPKAGCSSYKYPRMQGSNFMKQYTINMTLRMYAINPDEPLTTVRVVEWAALGT